MSVVPNLILDAALNGHYDRDSCRDSSPAKTSGEQKTSTTLLFNNYNPAIWLRCRRCRLGSHLKRKLSKLSASAWLRFFHFVDKMADRAHKFYIVAHSTFLPPSGSFRYSSFCRSRYQNTLSTQTKCSKYGKYGYLNTSRVSIKNRSHPKNHFWKKEFLKTVENMTVKNWSLSIILVFKYIV